MSRIFVYRIDASVNNPRGASYTAPLFKQASLFHDHEGFLVCADQEPFGIMESQPLLPRPRDAARCWRCWRDGNSHPVVGKAVPCEGRARPPLRNGVPRLLPSRVAHGVTVTNTKTAPMPVACRSAWRQPSGVWRGSTSASIDRMGVWVDIDGCMADRLVCAYEDDCGAAG